MYLDMLIHNFVAKTHYSWVEQKQTSISLVGFSVVSMHSGWLHPGYISYETA